LTTQPGPQFFKRSRSVVSRVIGGETLIVPVRGKVGNLASIYSFSGTGSLIWQLLEAPRALTELAGAVQREYGVRQAQAQSDVTQFVAEMFSAGLIEVCPGVAMIATESNGQVEWETAGSR
jgi:coenzyme PQQ synthesis protein D (PqqD)